mmetsp:Transcript_45023/g.88596  ORF Transcript_45023/g.88596 Transcript_45023/m.88596 type:complete len:244 (-) Transcript_45023:263-994(-)
MAQWATACGLQSSDQLALTLQAGRAARESLVAMNAGLVGAVCRKYRSAVMQQGGVVTMADLKQEATIGLIRAAEKFDPSLGFRFSTYATTWVRATALHSLKRNRAIALPDNLQLQYKKMLKMQRGAAGGDAWEATEENLRDHEAALGAQRTKVREEQEQKQQQQQLSSITAEASTTAGAGEGGGGGQGGSVAWLEGVFEELLVNSKGGGLKPEYHLDGTHLHPMYVENLLVPAVVKALEPNYF